MAKRIPFPVLFVGLVVAVSLALAAPAWAGDCGMPDVESAVCASLTGLGPESFARGISADGVTVVGSLDGLPARWVDGVPEWLEPMPEGVPSGVANAVTGDGTTIVGRAEVPDPYFGWVPKIFVWTLGDGMQILDAPPLSAGNDLSEDGRVIVGAWDEFFAARWIDGMVELLPLPAGAGPWGVVEAVSADGSIAVGSTLGNRAIRWSPSGVVDLTAELWAGDPGGADFAQASARGITPDGSIIVGNAEIPGLGPRPQPVRWDDLDLSLLDDGDFQSGTPVDVSADGSRIVGTVDAGLGDYRAALWNSDGSLELLVDHFQELDVDTSSWALTVAHAVSDDGRMVVGVGRREGVLQGFVATLSPTVGLDVLPGSSSNFIVAHPHSRVTVALYGSDSLDVAALDLGLLGFGPAGAPVVKSFRPKDLNRDGHLDRRLIFEVSASGLVPGDTEACLTAAGALPFRVCSPVQVTAGDCGLGFEVAPLLPLWMAWRRRRSARRSA